jgi:hypothetical protein
MSLNQFKSSFQPRERERVKASSPCDLCAYILLRSSRHIGTVARVISIGTARDEYEDDHVWDVTPCDMYQHFGKKKNLGFSEKSVRMHQTSRRHIPEEGTFTGSVVKTSDLARDYQ